MSVYEQSFETERSSWRFQSKGLTLNPQPPWEYQRVHCGVLYLFMRDPHVDVSVLSSYEMQQKDADRIKRDVEP